MPGRRRLLAALVAALVAASLGACDRDPATDEAGPTSTSSTTAGPTSSVPSTLVGCELGPVPETGEVTFVRAGQLLGVAPEGGASARCLADGASAPPQWNGTGDRLLFDPTLVLSKPTGKSLLRVAGGRLFKRPNDGTSAETDITFVEPTDLAVYHPAGEHIAAVGGEGDAYGIYVATNRGEGARRVTVGESAREIDQLTWTASGALVFVADHGGEHHLHRLEFPSLQLTELAEVPGTISDVAASRFEGAGLAWTEAVDGRCTLRVNRGGKVVAVPDGPATSSRAVGWLPGGVLVLREGCTDGPGRVLTLDLSAEAPAVQVVAEAAEAVAVRAALPIGPGLDLDAVVESRAPA
jgi:hypothetical protein